MMKGGGGVGVGYLELIEAVFFVSVCASMVHADG